MADYAQRREAALGRLRELVAARQRWDDMNYQRMEAEEQRVKDEAAMADRKDKLDWFDDAGKGAALGASVAGPIGGLVGAIGGTLKGQKEAYDERRKMGQGKWDSFNSTVGDTPFGFNMDETAGVGKLRGQKSGSYGRLSMGLMENGAKAYGSSKAHMDQDKARGSYQPTDEEIMGPQSASSSWGAGSNSNPEGAWSAYGDYNPPKKKKPSYDPDDDGGVGFA